MSRAKTKPTTGPDPKSGITASPQRRFRLPALGALAATLVITGGLSVVTAQVAGAAPATLLSASTHLVGNQVITVSGTGFGTGSGKHFLSDSTATIEECAAAPSGTCSILDNNVSLSGGTFGNESAIIETGDAGPTFGGSPACGITAARTKAAGQCSVTVIGSPSGVKKTKDLAFNYPSLKVTPSKNVQGHATLTVVSSKGFPLGLSDPVQISECDSQIVPPSAASCDSNVQNGGQQDVTVDSSGGTAAPGAANGNINGAIITASVGVEFAPSGSHPGTDAAGGSCGANANCQVLASDSANPALTGRTTFKTAKLQEPGPPTSVTAAAGNAQATVSFTAPVSTGSSAITSYMVSTTDLTTPSNGGETASGSGSPITVSGLTNGDSYTFTVVAINGVGQGVASLTSNQVIPATIPGQSQDVTAVAGDQQASVSWTPPASDGGLPVESYVVTATDGVSTCNYTVSSPEDDMCTVSGLTNGDSYTFTVVAINAVGQGVVSLPTNQVIPATIPGQPQDVTAMAGNQQAAVSWTPPTNDGGLPVGSYVVTASDGVSACTYTISNPENDTCTVSGLTNGDSYTFTVVAINGVGQGVASLTSNQVIPATIPGQSQDVTAVAGDQQASVSWTPPASDGGLPVESYVVTATDGVSTCNYTVSSPEDDMCTVSGLTNGDSYTFTVVAINAVGQGVVSLPSNQVTPITTPSAPQNVTASGVTTSSATISWSAPASNGGASIAYYSVSGGSGCVTGGTSCGMGGLASGTGYTVCVSATNAAGTGPSSCTSFSTQSPPPPPRSISIGWGGNRAPAGNWMNITFTNFPTGRVTWYCVEEGTAYGPYSTNLTSGTETLTTNTCYDVQHGGSDYVTADGINSNTIGTD